MKKKETETRKYIFDRGDVIMDLAKKAPMLILGVTEDECYKKMNLKTQYIKDFLGETHIIEKGSVSTQPADIVEKYYSYYELI